MIVTIALIFVPQYLYRKRLESLTAQLQTQKFEDVEAAIEQFDEIELGDRQIFLSDYSEQIIGTFDQRIGELFNRDADRYDYPAARNVLDRLLTLYPDSSRVDAINDQIEDDRSEVQAQLSAEYEKLIADGAVLPGAGQDVFDVLDTARELDPSDELLTDARLPQVLAAKARDAGSLQDFDRARQYLDVGLGLAPDDLELINVRDEVSAASTALELAEQIQSLEDALAPLLSGDAQLADFADESGVLRELAKLQPDNVRLVRAQARIEELLRAEVLSDVERRAWSNATARLEQFDGVVTPAFIATQNNAIDSGRRTFDGVIEALATSVDTAIAAGNLERPVNASALAQLKKLEDAGADSGTLSAARNRVATGFLDASRAARFKSDWETARLLAARAQALGASAAIAASAAEEISKINNQETLAVQEVRAQALAGLQQRFDDRIALGAITKGDIDAAMLVLTELRADYPDDASARAFADSGRQRLAERVSEMALALADEQRWQDAASLIASGQNALGNSPVLTATATDVAQLQREQASAAAAAKIKQSEERLAQMLIDAPLTASWQSEFDRQVAALEALEPGNRFAVESRERAAALYLEEAAALSAESRWSAAEQQLKRAEALAPALSAVAAQRALFESGRNDFERAQEASRLAADIKGKRDRFTKELSAGRVDQAEVLFRELAKLIDADDAFIANTGPQALVSGYLNLASENAGRDRYTAALRQLDLAKRYAPDDVRIGKAKTQYDGQRAAYNAVSNGNAGDLRALAGLLGSLKPVMADYTAFETRLQRVLTRRIEQRAVSNRPDAEALLAAAAGPFPRLQVTLPTRQVSADPPPPRPDPVVTPRTDPTVTPPSSAQGRASQAKARRCRTSNAGNGKRTCKDMLAGDVSAPILVVIPGLGGAAPFAVTRSEVPKRDFNVFCEQSRQCTALAGESSRPATGITADQIQAYADWLSSQTGRQYSIPTLEQWRHLASAGTGELNPNPNCQLKVGGRQSGGLFMEDVNFGGSDGANAWGVRQVIGNAQELVRNGSNYLLAGGAYTDKVDDCRIDFSRPYTGPDPVTGFRLVRSVDGT